MKYTADIYLCFLFLAMTTLYAIKVVIFHSCFCYHYKYLLSQKTEITVTKLLRLRVDKLFFSIYKQDYVDCSYPFSAALDYGSGISNSPQRKQHTVPISSSMLLYSLLCQKLRKYYRLINQFPAKHPCIRITVYKCFRYISAYHSVRTVIRQITQKIVHTRIE